ncbi:MAG: polyprenyl synthetase family protein [Candidatus Micrarchaeota archaeon]|nr:polyprenyl synthetase family protein [Candidatus Micrarchaeota archaeon]
MAEKSGENEIIRFLKETKPVIDKAIEKYVPRRHDAKSLEFILGRPKYAYDAESATKAVSEPIWDLLDRGGKRWRPALLLLACEALGGKPEDCVDFAVIPEVVHNGTLMVDDIEDDSALRRGRPCTHKVFGVDVAINAGNAMYYLPLLALMKNRRKLGAEKTADAYEIYVQEMINVSYGQAFDIWWHKGKKEPSEAEYLQMCAYKTGCLARMAAKLGALLAGGSEKQIEAFGSFAEAIGVAFQIQDDILNLVGEEFAKGKGVGEDIHEGKMTLLVIHALKNADKKGAARLREILGMHTGDEKLIGEAIAVIKGAGSAEYAKKTASGMVSEAWEKLAPMLPESAAKQKLKAFAAYLIERGI